ncbi:flavodoxin [Candidatus Campbellbacteria bacterium]|nr:flavodoxin [Candidatus Campbellbacteria bacterium]|tara:strand:- start:6940 stop:7656 length:717 start_codon:yes stop_codon:yes gene_type:complete
MEEFKKDYSHLSALYINTTLKKSPRQSHTDGLMGLSKSIMDANGVSTEIIRLVDHNVAPGVYPDMTKHGVESDEWPELFNKIAAADILVIGTPIWLGEKSSECTKLIERLYAHSSEKNDKDQYFYYGKVGGALITGNEDGVKHCAMSILYALQHIGYTIPPQADAGWIGAIGPGPSYCDEESGGPENDFTNRNTTFMTWNLMHMAALLKDNGGIPAHGNQKSAWENGESMDFPNPEYR